MKKITKKDFIKDMKILLQINEKNKLEDLNYYYGCKDTIRIIALNYLQSDYHKINWEV